MVEPDYEVGAKVASRKIGCKPSFVGRVVEVLINGKGAFFYHVRDPQGRLWHRVSDDLQEAT